MKKIECDKCHHIVGVMSAYQCYAEGLGKNVDLCYSCNKEYSDYMFKHSKAFFTEGSNDNV